MSTTPTASHPARSFSWRAFTSLLVTGAFAVLGLTGVARGATPPGRVANWSGWTLAGLTKAEWQAVHMVFGFLFVAAGALHLFFNWKVLLNYLRSRATAGIPRKRELAWALGASIALVVLSIADVPPISAISQGREQLANSWAPQGGEPPVPHAELLTVAQVARTTGIPVEDAVARLTAAGFTADAATTLAAVADERGVTPSVVYAALSRGRAPQPGAQAPSSGSGMGWKTVRQLADELGVAPETAQARLRTVGVDAGADETLRDIARRTGQHAPTLYATLTRAN